MIPLNLRQRVLLILSGFVAITAFLGLMLVWHTFRMEGLLASMTREDLAAAQRVEALETALLRQKGLAAYHLLDGSPDWLREQAALETAFLELLRQSRDQTPEPAQRLLLDGLAAGYDRYAADKAQVVSLHASGDRAAGAALHLEVHRQFDDLIDRIARLKQVHTDRMLASEEDSRRQAWRLRIFAAAAMLSLTGLTLLLAFVFVYQIMEPLRRITQEATGSPFPARSGNEVKTLSRGVRVLLHNVDHTQTELERSRESLAHAEKMALVGKLAAGMAHSIRNPFTSVKMRLFSLSRSLELDEPQQDDLEVIAGEIRHIDTIVQNFLEFSRPPRLRMQRLSPSTVVDSALRLLDQRLKSYGVTARLDRPAPLPAVEADPEQLKEVLVNLVVNACEAMPGGGDVTIEERADRTLEGRLQAAIRVRDSGPGVPPHIGEKIFDPFFSTKEHGTGLGLSIARRIITEHGGRLEAASAPAGGGVFTITLPVKEPQT
jgi:signal transduction histidine kinase